jgi:hypothetical protein
MIINCITFLSLFIGDRAERCLSLLKENNEILGFLQRADLDQYIPQGQYAEDHSVRSAFTELTNDTSMHGSVHYA